VSEKRHAPAAVPRNVVCLGGGTGLPNVLLGLREWIRPGGIESLTAVVTMTDDGGSSGRLRRDRGMPPPGDVRNCLVALATERDLIAGLFQHRYLGEPGLAGHNLGNLILTALAERTGSFLKAVELSGRVLRTVGRILPSTLDDVALEAVVEGGEVVRGETSIDGCGRRVDRVRLVPEGAVPTPGVVEALARADLVVLGPGSLFTSVLPHLALPGLAAALARTAATRVLVANLVSEHGRASHLDLRDHVDLVDLHAGAPVVDAILVNDAPVDRETAARYLAEGAVPLSWNHRSRGNLVVVSRDLLAEDPKLRHDPNATAAGLVEAWLRSGRERAGSESIAPLAPSREVS